MLGGSSVIVSLIESWMRQQKDAFQGIDRWPSISKLGCTELTPPFHSSSEPFFHPFLPADQGMIK